MNRRNSTRRAPHIGLAALGTQSLLLTFTGSRFVSAVSLDNSGGCAFRQSKAFGSQESSIAMTGSLESTPVNFSPKWRSRSRSNEFICHINAAGFASVMFALLLTFMVLRIQPTHGGIPVDLPKSHSAKALRHGDAEDALMIGITRDDKIFFRNQLVNPEQLSGLIREALRQGAENRAYIRADTRCKYVWVKEVLDQVRASGVENVAFITDSARRRA
jgi:biopolymer transport protein TolR